MVSLKKTLLFYRAGSNGHKMLWRDSLAHRSSQSVGIGLAQMSVVRCQLFATYDGLLTTDKQKTVGTHDGNCSWLGTVCGLLSLTFRS